MKKLVFLCILVIFGAAACKKKKDTTPPPQQDLWPTKIGNSWTYKVTNYTADGGSISAGLTTITLDGSRSFNGKTYYGMNALNMYYENEGNTLYVTDSQGSYFKILAKSVLETDTLLKETATYNVGGIDYNGTMARIASAYGTVIDGYTCLQITDLYWNVNGKLGKKVVSCYSPGTGPVSFLYYSNPENPNSDSVYRTQGLIIDSFNLN